MSSVCEEYLDIINTVVRDAYHYTYPRIISADRYIKYYGGHGTLPAYSEDNRWRAEVMERAFRRMARKDEILRRKYSDWELHPDFDAKRFYKVRESSDWVLNIYSTEASEKGRSRIALLSLEKFLDAGVGRITGDRLIKLFGWHAGEGYDNLQMPKNVKTEPDPTSASSPALNIVDLTQTPRRIDAKRKRLNNHFSDDDSSSPRNYEPSSPIPLFTPMPSPPPLRPTPPSLEIPRAVEADITNPKQNASASTQLDRTAVEYMLSKVPWLIGGVAKLQEKYPEDRFELVRDDGTLKFKCHDCPRTLYKAIYPNQKVWTFEVHLKGLLHRQNVTERIKELNQTARQEPLRYDPTENLEMPRSAMGVPSLVVIFPFAASTGGLVDSRAQVLSESESSLAELSEQRPNVSESDDRTKRRRLDLHGDSETGANPMKNLEHVGGRPTIRIRAAEKKQNKGGAAIQALVRANLRQAEQIGSLYQEHDALALQTSSLKEDRMRTWRLVLGIEGRHDELDDRIKKMNRIGNDLNGRVKALEYSRTKDRPLEPATKEKYTQLAHRLDTVEMRAQRQEQDISQAKELREKTTEVLLTLSGTFENHRDTIMEVKNSVERSKKWKKRLDEVTKEQKTRTEQLESEVQRQKEETRNFKTATEGQFNAMTKHHQEDSDVVMKRMAALEKIVESQNSQICYLKTLVSPRTGAAEAATSPGKICKRILSTGGHTRGFAIEKTIGIEPRQVANY